MLLRHTKSDKSLNDNNESDFKFKDEKTTKNYFQILSWHPD